MKMSNTQTVRPALALPIPLHPPGTASPLRSMAATTADGAPAPELGTRWRHLS